MERRCDVCGATYEAKRPTSRYCGSACRVRSSRKGTAAPKAPRAEAPKRVASVFAATLAELEAAGRVECSAGQSALNLAGLLDDPPPMSWSSIAGWAREHRAAMAEALKNAKPETKKSALDEIKARRDAKRAV